MNKVASIAFLAVLAAGPAFAQSVPTAPMNGAPPNAPIPEPRSPNTVRGLPDSGVITNEDEARRRLENAGYRSVTQLQRNSDGVWRGTAMRGAANVTVTMDAQGRITAQ